MRAPLPALVTVLAMATGAAASDRDRDTFHSARDAYQRELQMRRDQDRRFDRPPRLRSFDHRDRLDHRGSIFILPPVIAVWPRAVILREAPRVIFVDPVGPIEAVPVSPPFIDGFGRSCIDVRYDVGYGVACQYSDGSWRLVS